MMAKASQKELLEHTQRYIREIFAERLEQEGFVSYKGEDVHWYRLVNNEVIQSVYFITRHCSFPAFLKIGCGCHPLFIPPIFQKSPYMYEMPGYEQVALRYPLTKSINAIYRVPDVMVECPADEPKGSDILGDVFPILDLVTTPFACYELHKKCRKTQIENGMWLTVSPFFADEVFFWEDKSIYPFCKAYILGMINVLEDAKQSGCRLRKSDMEELKNLVALQDAFASNRQAYMQTLQKRELETLRLLEKNTNIRKDL